MRTKELYDSRSISTNGRCVEINRLLAEVDANAEGIVQSLKVQARAVEIGQLPTTPLDRYGRAVVQLQDMDVGVNDRDV